MPVTPALLEEARRLRLKKRFSQNFLVDESVLAGIADCLHLEPDETVLEIGAGAGFLTEKLLKCAGNVVAVELDRYMAEYLRRKFKDTEHLALVEDDILRFDFDAVEAPQFKVAGNLPYQITSKILFRLAGELEQTEYPLRKRMKQLTIMVQKEVGERITATPGQRAYNPLSIALQFWFETRLEFIVPAASFHPPPKVQSAVVTLIPRDKPLADVHDLNCFSRLVRTAFAQKRKTIRNALLNGGFASGVVLDRILESTGTNPQLRAEALSIHTFGEIANAFGADTGQN